MIAGLILAAGAGRRLGGPKAELVVNGVRLIDAATAVLAAGGCEQVVAVVRAAEVRADGVRSVLNPDPDRGMGSSLGLGLAALAESESDAEAAVIVLVDQCGITADDVARLISEYRTGASLVVARRGGHRSHPVLVGRPLYREFAEAAGGDQGGRAFIDSHPSVRFLDLEDVVFDIDTPADLALARTRPAPGSSPAARDSSSTAP